MVASAAEHPTLTPGARARILYVNADGNCTEREIEVRVRFTGSNGITYLRAWCGLREEERTFRTDRILALLEPPGTEAGPPHAAQTHAGTDAASRHAAPEPAAPNDAARPRPTVRSPGSPETHADAATTWTPRQPAPREPRRCGGLWLVALCALAIVPLVRYGTARADCMDGGESARRVAVISRANEPPVPAHDATYARLLSEREDTFAAKTGVRDAALTRLYATADLNGDAAVSWQEVTVFQRALDRSYRYIANDVALSPVEFMREGGGDCEDWAILTAGMLTFWGVPARVATVRSRSGYHAIVAVAVQTVPAGFTTVEVPPSARIAGHAYVPVDYAAVGRLSSAVAGEFTVTHLYDAHEIVGQRM